MMANYAVVVDRMVIAAVFRAFGEFKEKINFFLHF